MNDLKITNYKIKNMAARKYIQNKTTTLSLKYNFLLNFGNLDNI